MTLGLKSILQFGRYKGLPIEYLIRRDPKYLLWASQNIYQFELTNEAEQKLYPELKRIFRQDDIRRNKRKYKDHLTEGKKDISCSQPPINMRSQSPTVPRNSKRK